MNGLNNSADDVVECPLCMEPLEVDDLNFYPCTCGYQICRFCWHRIRTDENELCPACRKEYPENPADFTPLTQEEMIAFKSQKRQRDQQRKQKITENRKHLSNVRVVQRNLVFVVGLPPRLADADVLKKHEYFGKFGKIHKVVINPSTTYAGVQGPSASAYVTYVHNCDALRAIQSVNNIMIDGRLIKTSLGTTKYCSHFMKNQQCPKGDCMYLHELGDPEASFTKEEMHQGKHQEYEKRLHDALIATSGTSTATGMGIASNCNAGGSSNNSTTTPTPTSGPATVTHSSKNGGDCNKLVNGNASSLSSSSVASTGSSSMSTSSTSSTSSSTNSTNGGGGTTSAAVAAGTVGAQQKDAWPSLSVSPVNNGGKDTTAGGHNAGSGSNKTSRKDKSKHDKSKHEKNGRNRNKIGNNNHSNSSGNNSHTTTNKENHHPHSHSNGTKDTLTAITTLANSGIDAATSGDHHHNNIKTKADRNNKTSTSNRNSNSHKQQQQKELQRRVLSADEEVKLIQAADKRCDSSSSGKNIVDEIVINSAIISDEQRSLSTSSSNSSSDNTSTLSESTSSGKSSPSSFPDHSSSNATADEVIVTATTAIVTAETVEMDKKQQQQQTTVLDGGSSNDDSSSDLHHIIQQSALPNHAATSPAVIDCLTVATSDTNVGTPSCNTLLDIGALTSPTAAAATEIQNKLSTAIEQISSSSSGSNSSSIVDTTAALSKLNIFDDNNSFFSSATSFQQSLLLKNKLDAEMRQNQLNSVISSHLPDLLNGIDGFQNNTAANSNEWEEAFKNVMLRNNKQMEDQLQHPQQHQQPPLHHHHQQQQHLHQQEEFLRIQELQKRNSLLNNIGMPQMNGPHNDFPNNFHGATDLSRLSQTALIQHQQQILQQQQERLQHSNVYAADQLLGNSLFGTNMSKFFDFHKTQQQIHQQQFMVNGHTSGNSAGGPLSDHLRMASLLENNRINSQFLDKQPNGHLTPQQQQQHQFQKQRLLGGKYDPLLPQPLSQTSQQQQQQSRMANQFSHNSSVEDDLGFDPFIETQKALAELMENEIVQQQQQNTNTTGSSTSSSTAVSSKILQQQQQQQQQQQLSQQHQQQQILDNMQRARMPPPGFNHMNAFGFGVPRAQNSSKILPFMNMNSNGAGGSGGGQPPQQQQMQMPPNSWNHPHMAAMQQHTLGGDPQMHMNPQQQNQNGGNHNKGYSSSNDWTAMDPAILSFRQFSSFPQQQQQQPPMPHHPPQDLFMQHLTQQQQQQQSGFGPQTQLHGGVNLPNSAALMNPQNTAAQVNLSHSNWLSTEQSLFMNSLTNGFANNNFDKFSIPMPPGIHANNLNKQQKTECIN